jgi:hypothetical protein
MKTHRPTSSVRTIKSQQRFAAESNRARQSGNTKDAGLKAMETSIQRRQEKQVHRQDGKR